MSDEAEIRAAFPGLRAPGTFSKTSPKDDDYNCIAYAADDTGRYWWPTGEAGYYWPPAVPAETTLVAFEAAFGSIGYERCGDGRFEPGVEKIAIYQRGGVPTHAARQQVPDGSWHSKLGRHIDIVHADVDGLTQGSQYGSVAFYMARVYDRTLIERPTG